MPCYPMICTACQQPTEIICRHADRDSHPCPACGGSLRLNFDDLHVRTERQFYGTTESTSVQHWFHPSEVPLARRHFSDGQIHDNGCVTFSKRSEVRGFNKRMHELRAAHDPTYATVQRINAASKARKAGTYKVKRPPRSTT